MTEPSSFTPANMPKHKPEHVATYVEIETPPVEPAPLLTEATNRPEPTPAISFGEDQLTKSIRRALQGGNHDQVGRKPRGTFKSTNRS